MTSKVVKAEAERLLREHAADSYRIAVERALTARRSQRGRVELFRTNVAEEVSRRLQRLEGHGTGRTTGHAVTSNGD